MSISTQDNGNGTYDVTITCEGGCGRSIEQSNVSGAGTESGLPSRLEAMFEAEQRLKDRDGWENDRCRDCLIHAAGWQSNRAGTR